MLLKLLLSSAIAGAAAPQVQPSAPTAPTPIGVFLTAADKNDFNGMLAVMATKALLPGGKLIAPAKFIERISNCYLRRVYEDSIDKRILAAWMCDEGENKSRVVIGDLTQNSDNRIVVSVAREDRNNRPAPQRQGSAFAN